MSDDERLPRWPNDPPDDSRDLEKRADRYRKLLGVEDLEALTEQLLTLKKALRKDGPWPRRSYDIAGKLPRRGLQIAPLDPAEKLAIGRSRRPKAALRSWGLTGRYVAVTAARPFSFARLRFALPKRALKHLYTGTVVAARWDSHLKRFRLIPASGYSESGEYVYAQTTRTGIFTAIGLPRDPRLLLALRLLATLAPWARTVDYGGAPIAQPMLEALLKQKIVRGIANDAALLETFGYRKSDFGAALDARGLLEFAGGTIDRVLDTLPELDLLDALDPPNRMIKPIPDLKLPDEWPLPRGRWESLGPINVTGRIKALAIHPENGDILYAGAAGGGVWKTTNAGRDWFPTMREERSLAIGGLAIAPSNPDVLYAATGEWTGKDDQPETPSGMGAGVYRTSDGGSHWVACSPIDSIMCTSVAIHPHDADRLFVGGNRGLHRSDDGGTTWRTVLARGTADDPAGTVTSVAFAPDAPERMFAGVHNRGMSLSEDGGDTWRALTLEANGLPTGEEANAPKIAIGRGGALGSRLVSVKMDDWVFTSADGGASFVRAGEMLEGNSAAIPWCNAIAINPRDDSVILAGGTNLHRSADRGKSWRKVAGYGTAINGGQHAVAFHPRDDNRIYLANDGGVWASRDAADSWQVAGRGIIAAQCYDLSVSQGPALRVGVSLQDVSAHVFDGEEDWKSLGRGEGGSVKFAAGGPDEICADSQWSNLMWFRRSRAGEWRRTEQGPDTAPHASQPLAVGQNRRDGFIAIAADPKVLLRYPGYECLSWPTAVEISDAKFTSVVVPPNSPTVVYAGDSKGRIWFAPQSSANWRVIWCSHPMNSSLIRTSIHPVDDHILFALSDGRSISLFMGEWSRREFTARRLGRLECSRPPRRLSGIEGSRFEGALEASTDRGEAYSADDGATWSTRPGFSPNGLPMRAARNRFSSLRLVATHGRGVCVRSI